MKMIYLDYNSHAPFLKPAYDAMTAALSMDGNPSSVHRAGRALRKILDNARLVVKHYLHADNHNLAFTSGASEANAQVMHTFKSLQANIFISAIEHDSITQPAAGAHVVPVNHDGIIDLMALDNMLGKISNNQPHAISVMAANNETGVIQPIVQVMEIAKRYQALVHVDATQAIGRIPVNFDAWGVDYLTCSSHKIGGPLGAGVVISRRQAILKSLIEGGSQEQNRRAGTENIPAIAGFAAALKVMQEFDWQPIKLLRNTIERKLKIICPDVVIHGENSPRLANTSCIHMPNVDSMTQVMAFDLEGIAVSAGSACSSGKVKASAVLMAMGCTEQLARESIRVSLCPQTSLSDVEKFLNIWQMIYQRGQGTHATNNNTVISDFSTAIRKVAP